MQSNIYECINIENVINKLKLKRIHQIGTYIYVNCPFCQSQNERNGYMKVDTIKNLYICNNCENAGTSIELYARLKYMSNKEAFKELMKETPILDNRAYIFNNPIKGEYYRDMVYSKFLEMQILSKKHYEKLKSLNFTDEYLKANKFKTIENNVNKKKEICKRLQEQGLKLDGIPGFMQDKDFKWTYKSHEGIFIPVVMDNKIQGLRIHLDKKYSKDTENIWFSSNNEYNGTKASNWPMILKPGEVNWIDMYNHTTTIIVATEMILAHKLFNSTKQLVLGIPNNLDKEILLDIIKRMKIKEVFLYVDRYTITHTSTLMYSNVIDTLEKLGIKVNFRIALIDERFLSDFQKQEENIEKNVA